MLYLHGFVVHWTFVHVCVCFGTSNYTLCQRISLPGPSPVVWPKPMIGQSVICCYLTWEQRVTTFSGPTEGLLLHCVPACHTPWWLSATICWPTSDRPHKVNDRSHEVTDWPHQACVGAFDLSNCSLVPSRPHWMKLGFTIQKIFSSYNMMKVTASTTCQVLISDRTVTFSESSSLRGKRACNILQKCPPTQKIGITCFLWCACTEMGI